MLPIQPGRRECAPPLERHLARAVPWWQLESHPAVILYACLYAKSTIPNARPRGHFMISTKRRPNLGARGATTYNFRLPSVVRIIWSYAVTGSRSHPHPHGPWPFLVACPHFFVREARRIRFAGLEGRICPWFQEISSFALRKWSPKSVANRSRFEVVCLDLCRML